MSRDGTPLAPLAFAAALFGCAATAPPAPGPTTAPPSVDAPGPGVGSAAPSFTTRTIANAPLTLARGQVTVLVFWATWSEPDKKELGALQGIYTRLHPAVIALSIDDEPSRLTDFAQTYGLTFPVAWDAQHRIVDLYRPSSEPTTYVIDRQGIIRFVHPGYHDGEAERMASEIESLSR